MKSLYESAFSYITKQIDKRINALQAQCDAQIEGLEAQKKASADFYQEQIDEIDSEIKAIEKEVKAKQELIDSINEAAEARKRDMDLQEAQYNLERMQNQKTSNVYKDGQMIHMENTDGIRKTREEVEDKKRDIEIATIQKVIDGLEKQKDLLEERRETLEEALEASNAYWDAQIEQTQKHFDNLIKGMEEYKSQFEELGEIFENAQMEAALKELGINMDALLSGSQEEFEKLKTAYIGILSDMSRGNDGVIDQLSRLGGVSAESVSYLEATKGAFENLGGTTLEPLSESIDGISESTENLSVSADNTSAAVDSIAASSSNAETGVSSLNTELTELNRIVDELALLFESFEFPLPGEEGYVEKLELIANGFGKITEKCKEFSKIDFSSIIGVAGSSAGGSGDSSSGALPSGAGISDGTGFQGLVSTITNAVSVIETQMSNLQTALDVGNDAFSDQINKITDEYIPVWEELQTRLAEIIGVGSGSGESKDGGKKGGNKEGSESGSGDGSIIDIMQTGGDEVSAKLEDPWLKSFNEFATGENSVQSVCELIKEIVGEMASAIQEQCAAAAKALNDLAEKALNSSISIGTSSGNAHVGKAFAGGTNGELKSSVKNAMVGDGGLPEVVIDKDKGKYTVYSEPAIVDLDKGDSVLNGKQTQELFNNKGKVTSGNAFADGTGDGTIVTKDGLILRSLQPGDRIYELIQKMGKMLDTGTNMFIPPANAMTQASESMDKVINLIKNNNINQTATVTMNGGIHLHGVQDVNSLSQEINLRLPNMILQDSHRR